MSDEVPVTGKCNDQVGLRCTHHSMADGERIASRAVGRDYLDEQV